MGALSALEAKYCKQPAKAPKGRQKTDAHVSEPTEEEFAAAAERLMAKSQATDAGKKKKSNKNKA